MLTNSMKDEHGRWSTHSKDDVCAPFGGVFSWPVDEKGFCQDEPEKYFFFFFKCMIDVRRYLQRGHSLAAVLGKDLLEMGYLIMEIQF